MYRSTYHLTWVLMFQAVESDGAAWSSSFFRHCSWTTKRMPDSLVWKPFISWRHLSTTILVSKPTSIRDWTCVWSTYISLCLAGRFCLVGDLDEVTLTTNPELPKKVLFALFSGEILTHCSKRWHCACGSLVTFRWLWLFNHLFHSFLKVRTCRLVYQISY